VLIDKRSLTDV